MCVRESIASGLAAVKLVISRKGKGEDDNYFAQVESSCDCFVGVERICRHHGVRPAAVSSSPTTNEYHYC